MYFPWLTQQLLSLSLCTTRVLCAAPAEDIPIGAIHAAQDPLFSSIASSHSESVQNGFPTLEPAIIVKLNVSGASPHGILHTGSTFTHLETPTGTISSAPGFEPAFSAKVHFGADWANFDADQRHARLNLRAVGRTDEGVSISLEYSSVMEVTEAAAKVFTMQPDAKTMPFGAVAGHGTFLVGDASLKALENSVFAGNGRVVVLETGGLMAEHRLSRIVSSTAEN